MSGSHKRDAGWRARTHSAGRLRWGLAAASLLLAALAGGFAIRDLVRSARETSFEPTLYFDAKKAGIDIRLEHSRSYFEMTLLTLGALWGLVFAQKDEAKIGRKDKPEMVMLSAATAILLLSLVWHNVYTDAVSAAYSKAVDLGALAGGPGGPKGIRMPDVFQPSIDGLLASQARFFYFGVGAAVLALMSAHNLKEES